MERERGDAERAGLEVARQLRDERARFPRLDLVLDGDMRPPAGLVLGAQQAVERFGEVAPHLLQRGRDDPVGDPAAKVEQSGDRRRRRRGTGQRGEPGLYLGQRRGRKRVEQGEVRRQPVAPGREKGAALAVEPGEVGRRELGGDDQRAGQRSRSSLGKAANERASWRAVKPSSAESRSAQSSRRRVSPTPATPPSATTT